MIKASMTGHVESVNLEGGYDLSFVLTDKDIQGVKYPQHIQFRVSTKKAELADTVKSPQFLGAKVSVEFYVTGICGTSKAGKAYQINKLMVGKITVISPGSNQTVTLGEGEAPDDIPF